jgi:hypothetical protein
MRAAQLFCSDIDGNARVMGLPRNARSRRWTRENGVRSLLVMSHGCRHKAIVNVDMYPGQFLVLDFGSRMVCSKWGIVGADVAEPERAEVRRARH